MDDLGSTECLRSPGWWLCLPFGLQVGGQGQPVKLMKHDEIGPLDLQASLFWL